MELLNGEEVVNSVQFRLNEIEERNEMDGESSSLMVLTNYRVIFALVNKFAWEVRMQQNSNKKNLI